MVVLAPRETRVFDPLGPPILTSVNSIGALRIEANADVVASARIYGYRAQPRGPPQPFRWR